MRNSKKKQRLFITLSIIGTIIIIGCFIWSMQINLSKLSVPSDTSAITESIPSAIEETSKEGQELLETLQADLEQINNESGNNSEETEITTPQTSP